MDRRLIPIRICALIAIAGCGSGVGEDVKGVASAAGSAAPDVIARPVSCKPNRPCNDGNPCTRGDTCVARVCTGTPYSCDDNNVCTADYCDGAGGCTHVAISGPCNDGNTCTKDDTCVAGVCAGTPYSCDDGVACTADACDGTGGCMHSWVQSCPECPEPEICDNSVDDDCNGFVDAIDPACGGSCTVQSCPACPVPEICGNGIDDDCNGYVDVQDPACGGGCEIASCLFDICQRGYICGWDGCCVPHCNDGEVDGDEADVDCGGSCGSNCTTGQHCFGFWDCASGICVNGVCQ